MTKTLSLLILKQITFSGQGVQQNTFYSLSTDDIIEYLEDHQDLIKFVAAFSFEKGVLFGRSTSSTTTFERQIENLERVDSANINCNYVAFFFLHFFACGFCMFCIFDHAHFCFFHRSNFISFLIVASPYKYQFVQNHLYKLLNSETRGKIVLGRYSEKALFDQSTLVDIIILHALKEENDWK